MTRFRRLRTYGPMRSEILHGSADTFSLIWRVQRHLQVWLNMLTVVTPNRFRTGSTWHWILTRGLRHIPIPLHNSVRSSQSHSKLHPIDIQVSFSNCWCNTRIVPVKVVVVSLLQSHWTSVVTTVVTVLKLYSKVYTYSIQIVYSCITSQCSKLMVSSHKQDTLESATGRIQAAREESFVEVLSGFYRAPHVKERSRKSSQFQFDISVVNSTCWESFGLGVAICGEIGNHQRRHSPQSKP